MTEPALRLIEAENEELAQSIMRAFAAMELLAIQPDHTVEVQPK